MTAEAGKRYKHYRSGKEYTVVAVGRLESDPAVECVVYRAEYESPDFGANQIWIRPRANFEEFVEHEGTTVPHFAVI